MSSDSHPDRVSAATYHVLGLGQWAAIFLASCLVSPSLHGIGRADILLSAVICVVTTLGALGFLIRTSPSWRASLTWAALSVLAIVAASALPLGALPTQLVLGLALIVIAFHLGAVLSGAIESLRYIVPIGVVAAVADVWSVASGPTRILVEKKLVGYFLVPFPKFGTDEVMPVLGAADLVFIAIFLCLAKTHGLGVLRSGLAMLDGVLAALAVWALVPIGGIPCLPFIAASFVLANWSRVKPGKDEVRTTIVFTIGMIGVMGVISLLRWLRYGG